ncbi:hypothetical protein EYF80_048900 [Liparis tanakae]|uniref:Uncharacterized protein n=1 Tax=Liparis tanakae TaxID=230148 RepID=A0A4Z2FKX1_9TELE|nr:hypothetical protein EYF80_048900 [Liparis tanakae]
MSHGVNGSPASRLQLPQTKTATALRFRPLDSTSDHHLYNNVQPQAPALRPQYRGVPPLAKIRTPHNIQQTGAEPSSAHINSLKRGPHLRQPQPLLYLTTTGTGGQRTRRH